MVEIGGYGDLEFYGRDNLAVDKIGNPLPMFGRYTTAPVKIIQMKKPMPWPEGLELIPAARRAEVLCCTMRAPGPGTGTTTTYA